LPQTRVSVVYAASVFAISPAIREVKKAFHSLAAEDLSKAPKMKRILTSVHVSLSVAR
jgi:hypothetical protein